MLLNAHDSVSLSPLSFCTPRASFPSYYPLIIHIFRANLGVQVAHHSQDVPTVGALEGRLQLLIKGFFIYVVDVIGRRIALYD